MKSRIKYLAVAAVLLPIMGFADPVACVGQPNVIAKCSLPSFVTPPAGITCTQINNPPAGPVVLNCGSGNTGYKYVCQNGNWGFQDGKWFCK